MMMKIAAMMLCTSTVTVSAWNGAKSIQVPTKHSNTAVKTGAVNNIGIYKWAKDWLGCSARCEEVNCVAFEFSPVDPETKCVLFDWYEEEQLIQDYKWDTYVHEDRIPSTNPLTPKNTIPTQVAPRTAAEIVDTFSANEYVFDLLGAPASVGPGGTIQAMDANRMPAMEGHGMAATLFTIEPCGINQPHIHPRATETLYVIEGDNLRVAFVNENGHGVKQTDITKGLITFFPQGLIHYQQNLSCKPATYLSMLNSEDPGVVSIVPQFLQFEDQALQAAFGSYNTVPDAALAPGTTPGEGVNECRRRCGLLSVPLPLVVNDWE